MGSKTVVLPEQSTSRIFFLKLELCYRGSMARRAKRQTSERIERRPWAIFPVTLSWGVPCSSCKTSFPPLRDSAPRYFARGFIHCAKCKTNVDLWEVAKEDIKTFFGSPMAIAALGAKSTSFLFDLAPGEIKTLDFTEKGVPQSAVVISVNYTPQGGGCFPVEIHNNEARARSSRPRATVVGVALGETPGEAKIAVSVTWVDELEEPEAWTLLADAFQAATDNRFSRVVVPAYSAFEITVSRLIRELLLKVSSKTAVTTFMSDLSSAAALNVMVPFLCSHTGLKNLPEGIRNSLARLRSLRNTAVHEGLREINVKKDEIAELLCAAVFGFEFIRYARTKLVKTEKA
jgi:hypothetical protein